MIFHVFFMNFTFFSWISRCFPWISRFFPWIPRFFHEFHVFFMNSTFFSWFSRCFHEFHVFFNEFHVFSWISFFSMYSCTQRDFRQNLTNFIFLFMSFTRFSRIRALFHEVHVVFHEFHVFFHEFHVFFMNCTLFSWISRFFLMNFTFFHEFHFFPCIRARKGISDRICRISCSFSLVSRVSHEYFFMKFTLFSMNFTFFPWISRFFHELHVVFMNFTSFSWISRFFSWISGFFHEFQVFFMNFTFFFNEFHVFFMNFTFFFMNSTFFFISFTCFSRIRARTGIRAPNKRKHWKFSTRAHLRKMYTNTTAQTGQKRSIQIHFREDVHQYCKSKRLRNGSPTPPPRDMNGKTPST